MSESFVDLSYRGLALGKRIKLTQVRAQSGYLEMPTPMPVGTTIALTTDDGVQLEALVTAIHEQVGGSDRFPGMLVQPVLDTEGAALWWRMRSAPAVEAAPEVLPETEAANTAVMDAVQPEALDTEIVDVRDSGSRLPVAVEDDSRATQAMDAVDLAALGLASQSGQFAAVKPEDYADDEATPPAGVAPEKSDATGKTKRKRKRR